MTMRHWYALVPLVLMLLLAACVPETDIERAAGESVGDAAADLTPIPESDLPELEDVGFRVLGVNVRRGAGETVAEMSVGARNGTDLELADIPRVEWSDGEIVDALPTEGEGLIIESRRTDPEGTLEPVWLILSSVTYALGTDRQAEIRADGIETEWGTFPVLEVDSTNRPPGWKLTFQAAGQRWIEDAQAYEDSTLREAEGSDLTFTEDFRPVTAALQFDHQIEDLEEAIPLPAEVDIRVAVPEVTLDLT